MGTHLWVWLCCVVGVGWVSVGVGGCMCGCLLGGVYVLCVGVSVHMCLVVC